MNVKPWSNRNDLLNSLQEKIEKQTYGRLSRLDLDFTGNGVAVIANSNCYYDMQLALHAIEQFSKKNPQVATTQLEFNVNGHAISLNHQNIDGGTQTDCWTPPAAENNSPQNNIPTRHYENHASELTRLSAVLS